MKRTLTLALALLLLWSALAYQPTPELPPVVQKREDVPISAIITPEPGIGLTIDTTVYADPMEYEIADHWTETIEISKNVTIEIDIDILRPKATAYPVEKLTKREMSIERVRALLDYFIKEDLRFYQDMSEVMTKKDYAQQIIWMEETLHEVENGADGETPESIREYIAELEEKFKNAPDVVPENYYVDTPAYNDEGDIWLRMEYGDGRKEGFIAASLYSDYFWYERRDKGDLSMQSSAQLNSDNDIAKWRNLSRENLEKMEQNPMDAGTAMEIALQVMAELGITDMQLADVEPELLGGEKYDEHALRLTFVRECGGIPITMKWYRGFRGDVPQPEISYAPSLGNETVIFTISEAGVVESFEWEYAAEIIETIAADTQLLPMDEIKERIVRQIYYENAYWDSEGFAPATFSHCTVHIEKLELKYAYISVRHEPENALIVPVWVVSYRVLLAGYSNDYVQVQTILIHALDGGTVTTYH